MQLAGIKRLAWLVPTLLIGCRATPANEQLGTAQTAASSVVSPQNAGASASAPPSRSAASPAKPSLPKLKPIISKPFPEGADEATVCEAIDSKEPDLWVRFGHIVPAYVTGAIYVLETGPESSQKLKHFIENDYTRAHFVQQASCRGTTTLLYLRDMFPESVFNGKPFGRTHLSGELEKKFGIKTRDSYQFTNDTEQESAYCRQSAELCDELEKLDPPNHGEGLCAGALALQRQPLALIARV